MNTIYMNIAILFVPFALICIYFLIKKKSNITASSLPETEGFLPIEPVQPALSAPVKTETPPAAIQDGECQIWQFFNSSDLGSPPEHFIYIGCDGITHHVNVEAGTGHFGCVKADYTPLPGDQGDNPSPQGFKCS